MVPDAHIKESGTILKAQIMVPAGEQDGWDGRLPAAGVEGRKVTRVTNAGGMQIIVRRDGGSQLRWFRPRSILS